MREFENMVLRMIVGRKTKDVTGDWRRLHNEDLHSPPYSIWAIKSRRMRWAGHMARTGENRNARRV